MFHDLITGTAKLLSRLGCNNKAVTILFTHRMTHHDCSSISSNINQTYLDLTVSGVQFNITENMKNTEKNSDENEYPGPVRPFPEYFRHLEFQTLIGLKR